MAAKIYILDTGPAFEEKSQELLEHLKTLGLKADIRGEINGEARKAENRDGHKDRYEDKQKGRLEDKQKGRLNDKHKKGGLEARHKDEYRAERQEDKKEKLKEEHKREKNELYLRYDEKGLTLTDGKIQMRGDFSDMLPRLRYDNLTHELLVKAARMKDMNRGPGRHPVILDATAGMGEDSLLLAAAGFEVEMYEQNPVIAALLADCLERAGKNPALTEIICRMHLHEGDSIEALKNLKDFPDVIYLDPMFPERQKSALVKKKFQLLHQLEMPCQDEEVLLKAAVGARPVKVVVKRPLKGPNLAGMKPGYSLTGKAIRYDCFVFPENEVRNAEG